MKTRPILFSASMVRAILDGSKSQTRRVAKLTYAAHIKEPRGHRRWHPADPNASIACPYGQPGDRIWVREAWRIGAWNEAEGQLAIDYTASKPEKTPWITVPEDTENFHGGSVFEKYWIQSTDDCIESKLSTDDNGRYHWEPGQSPCRKRPSIHMPRWASRITLEITGVCVERLQDISEADASSEGCKADEPVIWWQGYKDLGEPLGFLHTQTMGVEPEDWMLEPHKMNPRPWLVKSAKNYYRMLWESINGHDSWDANPWVWVLKFKRITS